MSQTIRELTNAEKNAIQQGLNQTISPFFPDYSTPLSKMLVSPIKNSILILIFEIVIVLIILRASGISFKNVISKISLKSFIESPFVTILVLIFLLYPLFNYFMKVKKNNNIIESMKRLPEGATHMDYVSQSAVMSNRLLGRRGGFGSGFLGGMFAGPSLRRRR